jgi:hypothetical protein
MFALLISYFVFLVLFFIYSIAGIYHLWRFGYVGDLTKPAIVIYVMVVVSIIAVTVFAISLRSWPMGIS